MKRSILVMALASGFLLASAPTLAQKGQGGPKGPKAKVSQPAPKGGAGPKTTTGPAPKVNASQSPKVHGSQGPKVKSTGASTTKVHGPKSGATTQTAKTHGKPAATTTVASTKTTTATSSTGSTVTLSPVQQKLQKNTNLARKLEGRLPVGTDLLVAAEGFRNLGQFVAAVNVSNNLGIPFAELKGRMVDDGMSLGQAIQAERHDVDNVTTIVQRAERDAQIVIAETEPTTTSRTAKTSKPGKRDGK